MRKILIALAATAFATSAFAAHTANTVAPTNSSLLPNVDVDAIVDSVLGKDPPQGNCYDGYHVKTTKIYNARGKYTGKTVTCEEDD